MNTLDYWRNSLADADRLNPNFDNMKKSSILIDLDNIKTGTVPHETTVKLFGQNYKNNQISSIPVLLCPIIAYIKKEHSRSKGNHPETLTPLWVPALLNKDGCLLVANKKNPWIPRDYLDPCLSGVFPISTLSAVDQFLTEKPFKADNWKDYWAHTVQMFSELTDMDLNEFNHEQYIPTTESYILCNEQMSGATAAVQLLYDHIRENKPTTTLLNHFASIEDRPQQIAESLENSFRTSSRHYGQMGQQYPLSASQRESIHNWVNIESGELLALNGPPGTGKTTFLQSVISTSWIEAALKQSEPPIMVVSSSNNQPVTNVIESFAKIQEVQHPLAGRWIPQVEGYGSYLASSIKKEKELKPHWQTIKMDSSGKKGLLASIENLDDVSKAAYEYLEHATRFSGIQFVKVEDAVDFLHQSLVDCVNRMEQIIDTYDRLLQFEGELNNKYPEGIAVVKEQAAEQINKHKLGLKSTEELHAECNDYMNKWPLKWFLFIPIVRKIKNDRDRKFLESKGIYDAASEEQVRTYFNQTIANLQQVISNIEDSCRVAEQEEQQLSLIRQSSDQHRNQMIDEILMYFPDEEGQGRLDNDPLALLDRTLRYEAFKLAVHYWEGRWILETRDMLNDPSFKQTKGINSQQKLWRRYAKLTPCFVTTLFMVPSFFKAWQGSDRYLYEFIDTLIIDEAGQVTPELAGASFALAKKALIVGDILQIEPIWNIPVAIDVGNLMEYGVVNNEQVAFDFSSEKGITASGGSVMLAARRKTKYTLSQHDGGMWLVEHRRCVPDIINYCNELAYKGRLEPKRPSLSSYHLPHMGYAHIPGDAKRKNGSYYNEIEADAIVSWIHRNQDLLVEPYAKDGTESKSIDQVVAIITPFFQQKKLILDKLARTELKAMKNITVGTVHALQGAERPVVIFSPVYDGNSASSLFFDAGVNMLNVAVSRAQDSFLVFGDMRIFDPLANTPSGLLARYLFTSEEQEIQNVEMPLYFKTRLALPVDHIQDLEGHRTILANSIRTANKEVHIVSPFLSSNALDADGLEAVCKEAIGRGIEIVVYTDEALNKRHGLLFPHFIRATEMLTAWGVQVVITKRVHSKALWVDRDMLIEGSFNWLSAVRKPNSQWCRYETSLIFRGDKVLEMIEKIKEDLEKRMLVAQK
ncbi:AAA domain-containing protein [Paenibacillus sp. YIM B09110]|uniref:AAA domain-containing protein n=1 Tax=Paenibacillus sp. YIM B09110 TaxID=3126102 RepID=UPI00301DA76F